MVRPRGCTGVGTPFYVARLNILIAASRTANACYKDAADLHAELDEYPQAIAHYERVAQNSLSSPLTKYSVKEYWLRASLCALAANVSACASYYTIYLTENVCLPRTLLPLAETCRNTLRSTQPSLPLAKQNS